MLKVLLIDDNPMQLQVREAVLVDAGMSVSTAATSEEALALLRPSATRFDVIVTDHVLPGESGAVFVRQLRALRAGVPVLAISGLPEAQKEYQGLNVRFLPKPVPPEDLISCVRELASAASSRAATQE
ncbi:MAG TPA: response regulator [Terriglobales bacterium]|nr:response regulator [Terriglobales bacterium]